MARLVIHGPHAGPWLVLQTMHHEPKGHHVKLLSDLIDRHGVDVLEHLDRQASVPVLDGVQAQGDVLVVPAARATPATSPVLAAGVPVVRGENGGNTHLLLADGDVRFDSRPVSPRDLVLGNLTVAPGAVAYLAHPEHGYTGIGPGTYQLRRQREQSEQSDEARLVAD